MAKPIEKPWRTQAGVFPTENGKWICSIPTGSNRVNCKFKTSQHATEAEAKTFFENNCK